MIETPFITNAVAQQTAATHVTVPRTEIQTVMGPTIREVYAALAAQHIAPTEPWFTYHLQAPSYLFDFEACVPVATPVAASGQVKTPFLRPTARVARTVYHGPYEGLGDAWSGLHGLDQRQLGPPPPHQRLWECYLVGPETNDNPADWRTELNRPLL